MRENIKLSRRGFIKATGAVCSAVLMAGAVPGLFKTGYGSRGEGWGY